MYVPLSFVNYKSLIFTVAVEQWETMITVLLNHWAFVSGIINKKVCLHSQKKGNN